MKQPYEGVAYIIALARAEAERMEQQYLRAHIADQTEHGFGDIPSIKHTAKYKKVEAVNTRSQLFSAIKWIETQLEKEHENKQ